MIYELYNTLYAWERQGREKEPRLIYIYIYPVDSYLYNQYSHEAFNVYIEYIYEFICLPHLAI